MRIITQELHLMEIWQRDTSTDSVVSPSAAMRVGRILICVYNTNKDPATAFSASLKNLGILELKSFKDFVFTFVQLFL